jgi:hypothetical protein
LQGVERPTIELKPIRINDADALDRQANPDGWGNQLAQRSDIDDQLNGFVVGQWQRAFYPVVKVIVV